MGDGICQDHNNGPLCDYDHGDCCLSTKWTEETCNCCNEACLCALSNEDFLAWLLSPLPEIGPSYENCSEIQLNLPQEWIPPTLDLADLIENPFKQTM